jgi:ATP-dependent RNA helicase DHX57
VQPGICLKLFSSRTEKCEMKRASEPELRRIPLEEVCLNILAAGFAKSCMDFLCQTPQPPTEDAVRSALNVLSEIGAVSILKPADETSRVPSTEELTPLGQHLAKLPVDARLGKMLIFGALFRCIDTVLTVAASLSASQSIFSSSLYENQEARAARLGFADPQSDFLSLVNVWDAYKKCSGPNEERKFCKAKFLNLRALREIGDARSHYLDLLAGLGFLEKKHLGYDQRKREYDERVVSSSLYNVNGRKEEVIHAIICAGTYPNVARFVTTPGGDQSLWHKQERLFIHSSSVNAKTPAHLPSSWVAFHEKFGTSNRVSVSTTCFVHPFSLMIFGGSLVVKHTERKVCLDEWIELGIAAKTGVMFRELRKQVDLLLKAVIEGADSKTKTPERDAKATLMVEGIVQLLENNAGSM